MSTLNRRHAYWVIAGLVVLVVLVVLLPLRLGTHISGGADRLLYQEAVDVFEQEGTYAASHAGTYAPSQLDLATTNPRLTFAEPTGQSPITGLFVDNDGHGYFAQIADQSTGGAASFSLLVPRAGKPVLSCVGPGPLCDNGSFKLPASAFAQLAADQRTLYREALAVIVAEHRYAAGNGGQYQSAAAALEISDPALNFIANAPPPLTELNTSATGHAYSFNLAGVSATGYATFTGIIPASGKPILTCVGAPPLCAHGTFSVPASDYK